MADLQTMTLERQASTSGTTTNQPLRDLVKQALQKYFSHLEGSTPANLYEMVLEEVERPLLEAVLQFTRGNQCKAAVILGISRGTLRKKLKQYAV